MAKKSLQLLTLLSLTACLPFMINSCGDSNTSSSVISDTIPTFVDKIAPFIYTNCSGCHSVEGVAPFPISNYKQISNRAEQILYSIENGQMPPWKPDTTYTSFIGEPVISPEEIANFRLWAKNGMPLGDKSKQIDFVPEPAKEHESGPDKMLVTVDREFIHPGDGTDHYEMYEIELNNADIIYADKLELVGENKRIMHHAWVMAIPSGMDVSELNPEVFFAHKAKLLAGFLPNMVHTALPDGYSKSIPANSKLVVSVHYAHSFKEERDKPSILIHKLKNQDAKIVDLLLIKEDSLQEDKFFIRANGIEKFHMRHTLDKDMKLLAIAPHMHYRGQQFLAYSVRPATNDTTKLIRVNDWDFDWQNIYYYQQPIQLKAGDQIYVEGIYNNTLRNPKNPIKPPVDITWGERSMDEMFEMLMEVAFE